VGGGENDGGSGYRTGEATPANLIDAGDVVELLLPEFGFDVEGMGY